MSFFEKIFGKNQENQLQTEEAPVVLEEVPNEWGSFSTLIDDQVASIRLNLALAQAAPYAQYSYAMRLKIALLDVESETKFPKNDEFLKLNAIEDALSEALFDISGIYVGTVITDGHIEYYYYLRDKQSHVAAISRVMKEFPDYQYSSATLVDPEWNQYFEFLYPNEYEYQTILNQRIWYELEKSGDHHDQIREINHWICCTSEETQAELILEVEKLAYTLVSTDKLQDSTRPYQIQISRLDDTELSHLNPNVWELVEISKKYGGKYSGWSCNVV